MNLQLLSDIEQDIINQAISIINSKMKTYDISLTSPALVKSFLKLKLALVEQEVFSVIFLDNQHRVIEYRPMFFGTINAASVYPREVVKYAINCNSAAVILAHNHPSGISEPSSADISLTKRLIDALGLVDVRVIDHLIVGREVTSFAERGLI